MKHELYKNISAIIINKEYFDFMKKHNIEFNNKYLFDMLEKYHPFRVHSDYASK